MTGHAQRAHAVLGASSAHRWMACPGSIRQAAGKSSPPSRYAAEGTAAHELADWSLTHRQNPWRRIGETVKVDGFDIEITEEMADAVQLYVDTIRGPNGLMGEGDSLLVEQRFRLDRLHPGMFGTNDACIISPRTRTLTVVDLKYGKGHAVEARGNPQLRYYGLGALHAMAEDSVVQAAAIEHVSLVIVQPRAPHRDGPVRTENLAIMDLLEWQADLLDAARATEDVFAPLVAGEHCTFCAAAGDCPALRDKALAAAMAEFSGAQVVVPKDPGRLAPAEIARMLDAADLVDSWIAAVRAHALHSAEAGLPIPGYKLVDKRPTRRWRGDEADTTTGLRAIGMPPSMDLYAHKLLSPAQMEKLLPPSRRKEMEALVERVSSGRNLVRDDDARPGRTPSVIEDFRGLV